MPQCFSALLAEKAPVEEPGLVLGFEAEARVEFSAEPLVAVGDRLPEAEDRLGLHGDAVGGFVVRIERDRLFRRGVPLEEAAARMRALGLTLERAKPADLRIQLEYGISVEELI